MQTLFDQYTQTAVVRPTETLIPTQTPNATATHQYWETAAAKTVIAGWTDTPSPTNTPTHTLTSSATPAPTNTSSRTPTDISTVTHTPTPNRNKTIIVSSKQFTEQLILGNLISLLLQDLGYDVEYISLGGTAVVHDALLDGEIDIYPEYTGTGYLTHLGLEYEPGMTSDQIYQAVSKAYQERWNLTWLEPSAFNNTYCLAMTEDLAQELDVMTISDLQAASDELIFGATGEFIGRPDGLSGLIDVYGEFHFARVLEYDPGLKYGALDEGELDVTTCFGTDGQISAMELRILQDDLGFWPPYSAAPVLKSELSEADPRIAEILNSLMQRLDNETMSRLNWEVDREGREPADVALDFLSESGFSS
jgi:osmoprotectant transport system substrate-binding protein